MILTPTYAIHIPKHLVATHSFDLWGVLVDAGKLGSERIKSYRELAPSLHIPEESIEQAASNYQALINGETWATEQPRKGQIINELEGVLEGQGIKVPYATALYEDAISSMRQILNSNERVIIFTSKVPIGLREALPNDIAAQLGNIYGMPKNTAAFNEVGKTELDKHKGYVLSHTADELAELIQARGSLVPNKIFVNRNDSVSTQQAKAEDVNIYVQNLTDVNYSNFGQRR